MPIFPHSHRLFRPAGGRACFTEFRPPQWAEQIAIKKRGGIHFRLFFLLSPQVCERKRVRTADCNPLRNGLAPVVPARFENSLTY